MSFGVATFPADGDDGPELIDHADKALYYAKTHGRNQVRAWREISRDEQG
jgi:GGDEF domain-containing protein